MRTSLLITLMLTACSSYSDGDISQLLWDPSAVVSAGDGLYAPMPWSGGLVRLNPGEAPSYVDLAPLRIATAQAEPSGDRLLLRGTTSTCEQETPSRKAPEYIESCGEDELRQEHELVVWADGAEQARFELGPWFRPLEFSPDGRFAASLLDPALVPAGAGLINLNAMRILDLQTLTMWEVNTSYDPHHVTFVPGPTGSTQALVLSRGEVALIDLLSPSPDPDVIFPLGLEDDFLPDPTQVSFDAAGEHAIIANASSQDLYVLDLVQHAINIIGLPWVPRQLVPDLARDRTLVIYGRDSLDRLDHVHFDTESLELPGVATHLEVHGDMAIGWDELGTDAFRLDLTTDDPVDYDLNFPTRGLVTDPTDTVALSLAEASPPRTELLTWQPGEDGDLQTDSRPYALDGRPLDIAFAAADGIVSAILLQEYVDELVQLSWPSLGSAVIELPAPPQAIGPMAGGGFWVTHDAGLGLVTFIAADGSTSTVEGFATWHALDRPRLAPIEEN